MKKILNFLLIFVLIFPLWLNAQNLKSDDSKKLDSIYKTVKTLYKEQKNDPLQGRKYGIDFNIPAFIISLGLETFVFNAGFSYFDNKNKHEYAFPISYNGNSKNSTFSIDGHFRNYLGNTLNGFYIGGFARIAFVKYTPDNLTEFLSGNFDNNPTSSSSDIKFGLAFELGGKIISYKGWYWGWSIGIGKYIISNDKVKNDLLFSSKGILFDAEFLKVGYAFK